MIFIRRSMRSGRGRRFMTIFGTDEACWAPQTQELILRYDHSTVLAFTGHGGMALLGQAESGGARVRNRVQYCVWLALGPGAALVAGCVSPYYSAFPPPVYSPPPSYGVQPSYGALPAPVPLYPALRPTPEPAPEAEAPAAVPEPVPETMLSPGPTAEPEAPLQPAPDAKAAETVTPSGRPTTQAAPATDAPLQSFRPMRGQTRPGA